ncbi:MAG TPA: DUF3182 family protein [Noviherbaspirillum sp.]
MGSIRDNGAARGVVYVPKTGALPHGHECATHRAQAHRLADLLGQDFVGDLDIEAGTVRNAGVTGGLPGALPLHAYFVPADSISTEAAAQLGVRDEQDLFGGVVPHPFVATKTITHGLLAPEAQAPTGWSRDFAEAVREVTLPGYSAFALDDALAAGRRLLERGPVRAKLALGVGGLGQAVAQDAAQLERVLREFDADAGLHEGVVLESNLEQVATLSAGRVRLGELVVTYYGQQRLTRDNRGAEVYGGSDLVLVRGDFDALLALDLDPPVRQALEQASIYHAAALRCYPGLFASRCNYDIAQGRDAAGRWHSGVLEQSWRIGGASGAELEAVDAFLREPELRLVRASTGEIYGADAQAPADARIYYWGEDPHVGRLLKYARTQGYGYT